jgi:hypothetical protein
MRRTNYLSNYHVILLKINVTDDDVFFCNKVLCILFMYVSNFNLRHFDEKKLRKH